MIRTSVLFLFVFLLVSCGGPLATSTHQDLNPWNNQRLLEGNLAVSEQSNLELKLFIENTNSFPFENLYLKYTVSTGLDTLIDKTRSFQLQDDLGHWIGDYTGDSYVAQFDLLTEISTDQSVQYSIQQYSREDNLKGINSIFLSLEEK